MPQDLVTAETRSLYFTKLAGASAVVMEEHHVNNAFGESKHVHIRNVASPALVVVRCGNILRLLLAPLVRSLTYLPGRSLRRGQGHPHADVQVRPTHRTNRRRHQFLLPQMKQFRLGQSPFRVVPANRHSQKGGILMRRC